MPIHISLKPAPSSFDGTSVDKDSYNDRSPRMLKTARTVKLGDQGLWKIKEERD